jgi:flagellar biosynthesis protein FlhF
MSSLFAQALNTRLAGEQPSLNQGAGSIPTFLSAGYGKSAKKKAASGPKRKLSRRGKSGAKRSKKIPTSQQSRVSKTSAQLNMIAKNLDALNRKENIDTLKAEIRQLQATVKAMSDQMGPIHELSIREFADMPTPLAQEMMGLMEIGVEKHVARQLIEKATSSVPLESYHQKQIIRERLVQEMSRMIKTSGPISCRKGRTKVIALVGPTGVGKTTTLAKLAANSKFKCNKNVSLISADTYRMSAIEHLNTFAGIAHLPLSAVYSPDELKASLAAHRDKDLVFIDTAGRSPRDEKHLDELRAFMKSSTPDEIHLVLPANIKNRDILEAVRRFSILPIDHIVISKIDETIAPGCILNVAAETKSPISYVTNGQMIPDDIELANSEQLARMILRAA